MNNRKVSTLDLQDHILNQRKKQVIQRVLINRV
jgi:hypothetical protein